MTCPECREFERRYLDLKARNVELSEALARERVRNTGIIAAGPKPMLRDYEKFNGRPHDLNSLSDDDTEALFKMNERAADEREREEHPDKPPGFIEATKCWLLGWRKS